MKSNNYILAALALILLAPSIQSVAKEITYTCNQPFCTSPFNVELKPEHTDNIYLVCQSPNPYVTGTMSYQKDKDTLKCTDFTHGDPHTYHLMCTNWATIWGSSHYYTIYWSCADQKPKQQPTRSVVN